MGCAKAWIAAAALAALAGGCETFNGDDDGGRVYGAPEAETMSGALTAEQFVREAASGGLFEVESSRLAAQRATDQAETQFAERMLQDHRAANQELMAIAQRQGLAVPAQMLPKHEQMLDELRPLQAAEFTQRYHQMQVQAHDEAIDLFERAANQLQNAELREFARRTLPTLEEHRHHLRGHQHGGQ